MANRETDYKSWFNDCYPYNDKREDIGEIYNLYLTLTGVGGNGFELITLPNGYEKLSCNGCDTSLILSDKAKQAFAKYLDALYPDEGVETAYNFAYAMSKRD